MQYLIYLIMLFGFSYVLMIMLFSPCYELITFLRNMFST